MSITSLHRAAAFFIPVISLLATCIPASALELYVSPSGNDSWSGRLVRANYNQTDGPFATLGGAQRTIRKLRAEGGIKFNEPVRVMVGAGRYEMTEPFVFSPEDSGTPASPVSYEAVRPGTVVFSGGRIIGGWKLGKNGIWETQVPAVAAGKWYFEQLFVNGKRATRARTPNKFWFYMAGLREEPLDGSKGKRPTRARQTVTMRADNFEALDGVSEADLKDINLVVYHNWDNTRRFLDKIDPAKKTLVTSGGSMKPWNPWKVNTPFILENFRAALDEPGEWFLARNGTLYYMPRQDEDMSRAEVVAPSVETFLVIKGDAAGGRFVQHVSFKGLSFQHGQWLTPPSGFEPCQAAQPIEATIMADGARHIIFEDCEIAHVGIYSIWFRNGCRDNVIRHCNIHDFGAGAVRIGEASIAKNEAERTSHIVVDNNIIRHGGYIFPCAVGVWVGHSSDNQITHNEIADMYYTGISAGWCWGYGKNEAKRNTFAFNHIHHLGWGLLSDMGGIYTLGPSEGTVVKNNVFHDIYAYSYGGWGMYTDEGSTGILFENNLVYDTKTGGFHQHYGKENILRNNIFAFSRQGQVQATRVEPHISFTFERNIVYWTNNTALLAGPWDKMQTVMQSNCYFNASSSFATVTFLNKPLAEWQKLGHEQNTIIADPHFANPARRDFRLDDESPALKIGFTPFNPAEAGVYGDRAWKLKAKREQYPALEIAPEPPPVPVNDTFEDEPVGSQPHSFAGHVEGKGDSIAVTEETAASGKRSLKVTDAPGLKRSFFPYMEYHPNYSEGIVCNTFDLRIDKGTILGFNWRDESVSPYLVAAQFDIRGGKLSIEGKSLMDIPVDKWIHFEIVSGVGLSSTGKWSMKVTVPGQSVREFKDLAGKPGFNKLTWVGFTSGATNKTSFYLDNVVLNVKR